jgi:anti-sigma B factor antagonist
VALTQRGEIGAFMPDPKRDLGSAQPSIQTTRLESDVTIIAVSGKLDLASLDQLDTTIRDAERSPANWIVVDLDDLRFLDSTGLGLLLEARRRSMDGGTGLRFVPPRHEQVRRFLSLTDTTELFS